MVQMEQQFSTPDEILSSADRGFTEFIQTPQRNDRTIRSLGYAGRQLLEKDWFQDFLVKNAINRPTQPDDHFAALIRVGCFQDGITHPYRSDRYRFTRDNNPFKDYNAPEPIQEFITEYLNPEDPLGLDGNKTAGTIIEKKFIPTTSKDRYWLTMIVASLLSQRMPERMPPDDPLCVIDGGSSLGVGLKWWSQLELFARDRTPTPINLNIVSPVYSKDGEIIDTVVEETATERAVKIVRNAAKLALGVNGDIMRNDEHLFRLAEASLSPQEYDITNPGYRRLLELHLLGEMLPYNIISFTDDFSRLDHERFIAEIEKELFYKKKRELIDPKVTLHTGKKFVNLATMLYMQPRAQQHAIMDHGSWLAGPNGLIIVTDKIKIDPDHPLGFTTEGISFGEPWCYRTLVIDPQNPKPRVWFVSRSGRVEETMVGEDFGMVGDERVIDPVSVFGSRFKLAA